VTGKYDSLFAVPVIPLDEHHLLGDVLSLCACAETNDGSSTRISLLVSVGHTHASTNADIVAQHLSVLDDGNESEIVGKDVNIVGGRYGNSNFELETGQFWV
jgi:hypothetical protein